MFTLMSANAQAGSEPLRVGSKRFTESYILGEILTQTAAKAGPARHLQGLGNTSIVLEALRAGSIDVYPEYLGTIDLEILRNPAPTSLQAIRAALKPLGLGVAVPLGFNNTYALAVRPGQADLDSLSDLRRHPGLRLGLSHEFLGRADGWPGLARRYHLPQTPSGLDHGLAYAALAGGQVDAIDIYSTDSRIGQLGLKVLRDDLEFFPRYDALLLYRLDLPERHPAQWAALQRLEGRLNEADMIALNGAAELKGVAFAEVARRWLAGAPAADQDRGPPRPGVWDKLTEPALWPLARQHLLLVALSVGLAVLGGVPLGVLAARQPRLRQWVLASTGLLQTIPSLALLALMIALFGTIGQGPALAALFLYALLPVVRNTCTGLLEVPAGVRMAALALGLGRADRLLRIELPLAFPVLLAGVRTAAVTSVGTATIAAFIGAGGLGERISIGLATNDHAMLLAGALPAAALALLVEGLFALVERAWDARQA
jgi:osmoprotectant transport system permease protein